MNGLTNIKTEDILSAGNDVLKLMSESEKSYRQLADAMPQIVWTARPDGFLDYYNQRWFDYTGMTLEQTEGWGWEPVLHPDDLQNCLDVWSEAVRTGGKYKVEYRFKRASDGEYRWHLGEALPVRDAENKIIKWFGTCTDIHEQKRVEEKLRQAQEELESRVKVRTVDLERANNDLTEQVTERKQAEAELSANKALLTKFVAHTPAAVAMLDTEMRYLQVSQQWLTDYNLAGQDIIGKTHYEVFPDIPDRWKEIHSRCLAGAVESCEADPFPRADGTIDWLQWETRPWHKSDGRIGGIIFLTQVITERKRIEQALSEAAERERAMIKNALDVICTIDAKGRFISVNPACFRMWGYQPEELIGRRFIEFVAPEDVSETLKIDASILSGNETTDFENRYLHKNGTIVDVRWTSSWSENEQLVFAVAHDVTERKQSEERMRQSEEKYRNILDSIEEGYFEIDLKGNFTFFNNALCSILGYDKDEAQGMNYRQFVDGANGKKLLTKFLKIFKTGQPTSHLDWEVTRKDNTRRCVESSISLICNATQEPIGFRGLVRDVTERKRVETERQIISEIFQAIAITSNLNELLEHVHQSLKKVLYAENCFVALHNPATDLMHYEFWVDKFDPMPAPRPVGIGFGSYVLRTGQPLLLTNEFENRIYASGAVERGGTKAASWLGVPLLTPSGTIGVLVIQHYENENVYGPRDLELLTSVGGQIALAIERKRAEKEFQDSQQLLKLVIDTLPQAIWWKDRELNYVGCNRFLAAAAGFDSPEKMIGLSDYDMPWTKDEADFFRECDRRVMESGVSELNIIEPLLQSDGKQAWVNTNKVPLRNASGEIVGVIGTFADITESKHAEEALALESRLLQALMDNIPDAIYFKDTQSRFTRVSKHVHLKGIKSPEDAIGKTDFDFFSEEIARPYYEDEQRIVQTGEPLIGKVQNEIFPDGTNCWVMATKVPIFDAKGKVTGMVGISRDITELKRAEEAMQNSRDYLARIINAVADPIFVNDQRHRVVLVNDALCQLTNLTREETIGKSLEELCQPKEARLYMEMNNLIFEGGKEMSLEERLIDQDGNRRFTITKKSVYQAPNGEKFIVGVINDLTERKKIEEALLKNEAKFRDLFDNAPVAYHELDTEGRFTRVNHTEELLLGYSEEELNGRYCSEIIVEKESREAVLAKLAGRMQLHPLERTFVRKDGSLVSVLNEDRLIYDEDGNVTGIRSTLQNITQRKMIEQRQSAILDALPAHICLLDESGKILEVNNEWKQFALGNGYTGVAFGVGSNYVEICETATGEFAEGTKQVAEMCRAVLSGEVPHFEMEQPCHSPNEKRWFKLSVTPLHKEKLAGAVVMHINITERKRIEEELELTRDAALESVRLKSEFLANMSHEIRTPMNGVLGMTGLLLDTELSEEQLDYAQTTQSSADALLRIIDDILDFSKIEAGQLHFEKIDFDLRECVESPLELLAERAQSKGIEIASLVYEDVPTLLCGDPGRLRQILTNLIGNAIKFTENGEVTVKVRKQSDTGKSVWLLFEVTDTGIGISEQAQSRLFRAFTQADGSTTRKYGGTGLGLAISKQLVELMGGEIGVESAPGKGSTFWFTARLEKQLNQAPAIQPVHNVSLEGVRILIVDDNATNRKIFLHQTTSWRMRAAEAESGQQALEMLRGAAARREPFEIAILDLMMPEMDGFELARAIKSDPSLSGTHLVLLPSYGKRGDGQSAREFGIAAYIQKPVRQSLLYNCLIKVIAEASGNSDGGRQSSGLITQHSLRSTIAKPNSELQVTVSKVHILVAEDNPVNQKVALSQLKSMGYAADVASNGREAVEAIEKYQYDVVLMDCQMPEMDGYEATAAIRRREGTAKHTPIIAMTAHALDGEREKCLAAGMDDYISKPVKVEELKKMLAGWLSVPSAPTQEAGALEELEKDAPPPVDMERLYSAMGDEPEELREILDIYLEQMEGNLKKLKVAITAGDAGEIDLIAHNCSGVSANCGMIAVVAPLRELERMGREGQLTGAVERGAEAEREFNRIKVFLEKMEVMKAG